MKYFEIIIQSCPENNPVIIKINVGMRLFSDVKLFIPKVNGKPTVAPNKRWYIYFYFENSVTKKKKNLLLRAISIDIKQLPSEKKLEKLM